MKLLEILQKKTIADISTPSILFVDDDPDVLRWTRKILAVAGYPVCCTSDPNEAAEMLGDSQKGVDLLVTDICMPNMNGPDLAREAYRVRPDLRVLFISGGFKGAPQFRWDDHQLSKPFTSDELLGEIRKALSDKGSHSGWARAAAAGWSGPERRS